MVLTKEELLSALRAELRLLLHLAAKLESAQLHYRPATGQRSTLELLQYLTIMGPIHFRGVLADSWSREAWGAIWQGEQANAQTLDLAAITQALAAQGDLYAELLAPLSDQALRQTIEMFGMVKATRGALLVSLVLNHYAAYRMQLFLYLKASGHPQLNTMNLWAGVDHF